MSRSDELYGPIEPVDYLLGKFDPAESTLFIDLQSIGIPCKGKPQYIRKEAAAALKKMMGDFHKVHPGTRLWVASGARNYSRQKAIWEAKWTGKREVDGKKLPRSHPDPLKRALKILAFSSMPGTSRHHWGTDIDFNILNNDYYKTAEGRKIYNWMKKNMHIYGFCQVYSAGRKRGYNEEKWHWSYLPLGKKMTYDWLTIFGKDTERLRKVVNFKGSRTKGVLDLARIYVAGINSQCQ